MKCGISKSGEHEPVDFAGAGEFCKHCSIILKPIDVRGEAEPMAPDFENKGPHEVSNDLMDALLADANGQAAFVVVLRNPMRDPSNLGHFHITTANAMMRDVPAAFDFIIRALTGRIRGVRFRGDKNVVRDIRKPCDECDGTGYFVESQHNPADPHGYGETRHRCLKCNPPKEEPDELDQDR